MLVVCAYERRDAAERAATAPWLPSDRYPMDGGVRTTRTISTIDGWDLSS
jgi:hypothetical protein